MAQSARFIVKDYERKARKCAACGKPVGTATIVIDRDGWGEGPKAPLCLKCSDGYSCEEIWTMIHANKTM
jgi:hypothetical protein